MKNIFYLIYITFALVSTSCSDDFLDTKPYDKISSEQTWGNVNLTSGFVYQLYNDILADNSWVAGYATNYSARSEGMSKNVWVGTLGSSFWSNDRAENMNKDSNYGWLSYSILWRIHTAMDEVSKSPTLSADFKKRIIAELHFLRASHYFVYAKQFGGLQIIDKVLTTDDNLQIPKSSIKDTYDFILSDLEKAATDLPVASERGRASKAAAYAQIMRVAVQAAAYVDGGSAGSAYYDKTIAAGNALNLTAGANLSPYANMFNSYETAVTSGELILTRERLKVNTSLYDVPMQYQGLWNTQNYSNYAKEHFLIKQTMNFWGMDGGSWPTQDLVDDYLVADTDGSIKFWANASYAKNPAPGADVDDMMYFSKDKKRDRRFYATVLYDSCKYFNGEETIFFRTDGNCSNARSPINIDFKPTPGYVAGDRNNYNSETGYAMIKYHYDHVKSLQEPGAQKLDFCFSVLRYGEAYLNMAEAYLMKGDFANAKKYMAFTMVNHGGFNAAKVDAYLAPLTGNNFGDPLFEAYKRERNVEMVYENNDRYWSLLRWGMRKSGGYNNGSYINGGYEIPELNGALRGIKISRDGQTYEFFEINNSGGQAKFTPKRYLLPINNTFSRKSGVTQNPGWE